MPSYIHPKTLGTEYVDEMTWASFLGFVHMKALGEDDTTMRSYDLLELNGSKPGVVLDRAAARMGIDQQQIRRGLLLPLIGAMMKNSGVLPPILEDEFALLIREWYNWDRIVKGEITVWPSKKPTNLSLI